MMKAIAESRGWEHGRHRHLHQIASRLRAEVGDRDIYRLFNIASALHENFYLRMGSAAVAICQPAVVRRFHRTGLAPVIHRRDMFARIVLLLGFLMIATASCGPATPKIAEPESSDHPVVVAALVASRSGETTATEPPDVESTAVPATPILATVAATVAPVIATAVPDAAPPMEVPSNAETVVPSAKANEVASNWLMSFTHTNPDYIRDARSAFAYVEDEKFCKAAGRFGEIAMDARDYAGERLPIAAYNAGALYLTLAWDDRRLANTAMCIQNGRGRPALNSAVSALEYALQYMMDDQHKAAAHLLLGRAYANLSHMEGTRLVISDHTIKEQAEIVKERATVAIEHLCQSMMLDSRYSDQASKILAELGGACGQQ